MPGRIDTSRKNGVIAHVHLLNITVVDNNCPTVVLTGMKLHALRVILLIVVTVDALTVFLESTEHIIIDDALIIVFQTALTNGQ